MKIFFKKIEDAMAAVAFAEACEFETALEIMKEQPELAKSLENEDRRFGRFASRFTEGDTGICRSTGL